MYKSKIGSSITSNPISIMPLGCTNCGNECSDGCGVQCSYETCGGGCRNNCGSSCYMGCAKDCSISVGVTALSEQDI